MPKREYLGDIDSSELGKLFENKHRVQSLIDLKKTLQDPSPVVTLMLDGISMDRIDGELKEARVAKEKGFSDIYNKYGWMQTTNPGHIYISEDGKVYKTCSREDCQCNSKTCGE
jgi:hypothetical protein